MKILHIGDFHYKSGKKNEYDQKLIVNKLNEKLKNVKDIEYVFFTGDLVFSGEKSNDFYDAHDLLFNSIKRTLNLTDDRIFICPGNHDINRSKCSIAIINYFDKSIKNNVELDEYYNSANTDLNNSFLPSQNFYDYLNKNFSEPNYFENNIVSAYIKECSGKKIGIMSLNSSWLSSGIKDRNDEGNLLVPINVIKNAISKLDDCKIKIALIHHPLHNLKETNSIEVEDIIHKEFNLMFSGHLHKEKIEAKYTGTNGIYCNTTQAALTFDEKGEIGFSIIDFDIDDETSITVNRSFYLRKEDRFIDLESVHTSIPCGTEKHNQNKLRQKITVKYQTELQVSNQLLLNYDEDSGLNFIESFTDPVISKNSETDEVDKDNEHRIHIDNDLLSNKGNYLIFGKDKCGKTSLLKKIQLYFIKNYTYLNVVPLYIDYKDCEQNNSFDLVKYITTYYQINNQDAKRIIEGDEVVLLVDNLNPSSHIHESIVSELKSHANIKFIVCSDYITSRVFSEDFDGLEYQKVYFKDLTRSEIRKFTDKNSNLKNEEKEIVHERISLLCKQLQLPVNYWTVSLITLIYKKTNNDFSKNLFSILDICVDEILNKKRLLLSKSDIQFDQYKDICSEIAHYLLTKHSEDVYSATHEELIAFISEYAIRNPRIVGDSREIFEYLFEVGLLKKRGLRYTYRLNGIFEYFLAYYIKEHPEFKEVLLENDSILLSFQNELEIYSGFSRNDERFLKALFEKTTLVFDKEIKKYKKIGTVDFVLNHKLGNAESFAETVKKLKVNNPLSYQVQDAIQDQINPIAFDSEVHLKELKNVENLNYEVLEKYLSILAKVFKNSDGIKDLKLIDTIFDYLIEAYCILGFILLDECEKAVIEENLFAFSDKDSEHILGEEIVKLIAKFIPILTQVHLVDGIGHANFSKIVHNKIDILKVDSKNNQFKLFLLYFLLIDIDINKNKDLISDVFEIINMPTLKVSTVFKLNFYHAFKANNNKKLEQFFLNSIQKGQMRLDNKVKDGDLQQPLAEMRKKNLRNK